MVTGRDILFWLAGFVALGLVVRVLRKRESAPPPLAREDRRTLAGKPAVVYYLSLAFLVATIPLSAMLAAHLGLEPLLAYAFLFVGIGVLVSFAMPLVVSRSLSKRHYEDYWTYIIEGSGVSRQGIVWTAVGAALFMFAAGAAMLIFGDGCVMCFRNAESDVLSV